MQTTQLFTILFVCLLFQAAKSFGSRENLEGADSDTSLSEFLDSCFAPPSLCYYLLLVPSVFVVFVALCCSKWVGYMFFKHN